MTRSAPELLLFVFPRQCCHNIHHHQDILLRVLVPVKAKAAGSIPEQSTQCPDSHRRREGLPPSDVREAECKCRTRKHNVALSKRVIQK